MWCFLSIATLCVFPLLLQRKRFQDEGMLLVARGKRGGIKWAQVIAWVRMRERGRWRQTWRYWERNLAGGGVIGNISHCCQFISYCSLSLFHRWWLMWYQWVTVICFHTDHHFKLREALLTQPADVSSHNCVFVFVVELIDDGEESQYLMHMPIWSNDPKRSSDKKVDWLEMTVVVRDQRLMSSYVAYRFNFQTQLSAQRG